MDPDQNTTEIADASTPEDLRPDPAPAGFDVPVQSTPITSDILEGNTTFEDVRAFRDRQASLEETDTSIDTFRDPVPGPDPFNDPERFIRSSLFGDDEPTEAEQGVASAQRQITDTIASAPEDIERTARRAENQTDFGELTGLLADTNNRIARRQSQFRRELREFDLNAERRGVAREFIERDKQKLKADATAELADLYIIQNAQQGNVQAARSYIETAVNNRYRSIELELQRRQSVLQERLQTLDGERRKEAQQLSFAIQERQNNISVEREHAKLKRDLLLQAAAEGAPAATQQSILNGNLDNAYQEAGKWVGLLDREYKRIRNAKANQEYQNALNVLSGVATGLDDEMRAKIGKAPEARQAQSLLTLNKNLTELYNTIEENGVRNPFDRDARNKIASLRSQLEIDIAVAGGQGAISEQEADRYQNIIGGGFWETTKGTLSAIDTAKNINDTKIKDNLSFLEATIPGSSQFEPFQQYYQEEQVNNYLDQTLPGNTAGSDPLAIDQWLTDTMNTSTNPLPN